jgi:hypothetical protein
MNIADVIVEFLSTVKCIFALDTVCGPVADQKDVL